MREDLVENQFITDALSMFTIEELRHEQFKPTSPYYIVREETDKHSVPKYQSCFRTEVRMSAYLMNFQQASRLHSDCNRIRLTIQKDLKIDQSKTEFQIEVCYI